MTDTVTEAPVVQDTPAGDFTELTPESVETAPEAVVEPPVEAAPDESVVVEEVSRIMPDSSEVQLSNGCAVTIERLRTRQFLKLLKILTRGAGAMLMEYRLDGDLSSDEFQGRLIALIGLSIPEAEDEAIDFLRAMTVPVGIVPGSVRSLSKDEQESNEMIWARYEEIMINPELDDLIDIIERVVKAEAGDMQRLGKRVGQMISLAQKTGQFKK